MQICNVGDTAGFSTPGSRQSHWNSPQAKKSLKPLYLFVFQGDFSSSSSSLLNSAITPAPGTLVTVLKPRSTVRIPVQFQPRDERLRTSVVLIR